MFQKRTGLYKAHRIHIWPLQFKTGRGFWACMQWQHCNKTTKTCNGTCSNVVVLPRGLTELKTL